MTQAPNYCARAFDPHSFRITVGALTKKLRALMAKHKDLKAVAACGQSGIPVASALALTTGLALTTVRKDSEKITHSGKFVTGYLGEGKYVIVDDLVDSGSTVRHIVSSIGKAVTDQYLAHEAPKPLMVLVYYSNRGSEVDSGDLENTKLPIVSVDSEVSAELVGETLQPPEVRIMEAYARARDGIR